MSLYTHSLQVLIAPGLGLALLRSTPAARPQNCVHRPRGLVRGVRRQSAARTQGAHGPSSSGGQRRRRAEPSAAEGAHGEAAARWPRASGCPSLFLCVFHLTPPAGLPRPFPHNRLRISCGRDCILACLLPGCVFPTDEEPESAAGLSQDWTPHQYGPHPPVPAPKLCLELVLRRQHNTETQGSAEDTCPS